jgi:DNA-binding MarR family transcriptional regulator
MGVETLQMAEMDQRQIPEESRIVLDSIRRIVQVLRKTAMVAEKRVGLSAAQLFIVRKLVESGSLSVGDLAKRTATSQSSVSEVVQRLVTSGLVSRQRSARDGRSVELSLTESGQALAERSPEAVQDQVLDALNRMHVRDRKQLAKLLGTLLEELGIANSPVKMLFEEPPRTPTE